METGNEGGVLNKSLAELHGYDYPKLVWCWVVAKQSGFLVLSVLAFFFALADSVATGLDDSTHRITIQYFQWFSFGLGLFGSIGTFIIGAWFTNMIICDKPVDVDAFARHAVVAILGLCFTYTKFNKHVLDPVYVATSATEGYSLTRYEVDYAPLLVLLYVVDIAMIVQSGVLGPIRKIFTNTKKKSQEYMGNKMRNSNF
jgi:hypothetical protein